MEAYLAQAQVNTQIVRPEDAIQDPKNPILTWSEQLIPTFQRYRIYSTQNQMEENILSSFPDYKLYKDRSIYVGTFLGGPLVAGYLAAENYKKLGQPNKVKNAWIIAILATIAILGALFFLPGVEKIPNYIIPLIYTGIAQFLVQKYQGNAIKAHIAKGGQVYSTWRAVWIGLIGVLVLVAIIAILMLLTDGKYL
jgi:4-amino-4-deoxy-L-arabinose transferase-like glycosyltransferase